MQKMPDRVRQIAKEVIISSINIWDSDPVYEYLHSLMIVFQYSRRIVCVIRSIPVPPNLKNHRIFQTHCLKNPTVFVGTDYLALT